MTKTMGNKYPGKCARCGQEVPAGGGVLYLKRGLKPRLEHRPSQWVGSPVSGQFVGGCPGPDDKRGAV